MRLFFRAIIFSLAVLFSAQLAAQQPTLPPGVSIEDVEKRRQELIDRGVPEEKIDSLIQAQSIAGEGENPAEPTVSPQVTTTDPIFDTDSTQKAASSEEGEGETSPLPTVNIFGHEIFRRTDVSFNRAQSLIPPDNYLVGPGDVFTVTIWGSTDISEKMPVQADGSVIYKGSFGKIYVAGLTYIKARNAIINRFRRTYMLPGSSIEVELGQNRRTINVNIVGEVQQPGTYKIPASTSAFNSLFEAGGILPTGSVRNILIRRNGKTIQTLDIYDYLLSGKDEPIFLQEEDLILVPIQGRVVNIQGSVKRPLRYELKEDENLMSLIEFSGGLNYDAVLSNVQLRRVIDEKEELIDFNLSALMKEGQDFPLTDGDELVIRDLLKGARNFVEVEGLVRYPDTYEILEGERLADVVARAGGPLEEAYLETAYIVRLLSPNELSYIEVNLRRAAASVDSLINPPLQVYDKILVFSKAQFFPSEYILLEGAVQNPGDYELSDDMSLRDLFFLAGGLQKSADRSFVDLFYRLEIADRALNQVKQDTSTIKRIKIDDDWQTNSLLAEVKLKDFERVKVYDKSDFIFLGEVDLKGLVNRPGTYQIRPQMSLKDILFQAGGFEIEANYNRIELSRIITKRNESGELVPVPIIVRTVSTTFDWQNDNSLDSIFINSYDQIFVRKNPAFELQESVFIQGEVITPGEYNKEAKDERISSLIAKSGGLTRIADIKGAYLERPEVGRISIRLDKAMRRPGSNYDIPLLEGDILVIPPRTEIVKIEGNVLQPGTVVQFEPGRNRYKYYVDLAGGFDNKTKRNKCTIQYADGRFRRTKSFLGIRSYPSVEQGSTLMVAKRPEREKKNREDGEGIQFEEVISGLTAILTLVVILRQINP
jgi:protein involved in polysaccharide export with SLBB domain